MSENWKPGDVAMMTWSSNADGPFVVVRGEARWHMIDQIDLLRSSSEFLTDYWLGGVGGLTVRRLLVIDPDDREQVERLAAAYIETWTNGSRDPETLRICADQMQTAIRAMLQPPKPPKPDEPLGLGAVVLDASGDRWVRTVVDAVSPWGRSGIPQRFAAYKSIDAVEVLSEGVR